MDIILKHCSFDYMKKHGNRYVPFAGEIFKGGIKTFMNKGINGRWKDVLTKDDIKYYEKKALEELGAECANWLETGKNKGL